MNNTIISIKNVSISYTNNVILENINLEINKGDFIYLIGETGSGKSSLLKALYKGIELNRGSIIVSEYDLKKINTNTFYKKELIH